MQYNKTVPNRIVSGVGKAVVSDKYWTIDLEHNVKGKNGKWEVEVESLKFKHSETGDLEEIKNKKQYMVSVKPDGKGGGEILQLRPAIGNYQVKFSGWANDREDEDAVLILEKKGDFGKYWEVVANLEVVGGEFAGVIYPLYVSLASEDKQTGDPIFKFSIEEGIFTVYVGSKSGEKVKRFRDLVKYSGLSNYKLNIADPEDLEVDEILRIVEKGAKKLKKVFSVTVEDGYPKTLSPFETDEDAEEVEVEKPAKKKVVEVEEEEVEETPVKKPAKKVVVADDEEEETQPKKKATARKPQFDEDDDE